MTLYYPNPAEFSWEEIYHAFLLLFEMVCSSESGDLSWTDLARRLLIRARREVRMIAARGRRLLQNNGE